MSLQHHDQTWLILDEFYSVNTRKTLRQLLAVQAHIPSHKLAKISGVSAVIFMAMQYRFRRYLKENIAMNTDRRQVLIGAAAGTAIAMTGTSIPASAAAPLATGQAPGFYRYKIGDLQITAINDGVAQRPLEGFIRNADINAVRKAMDDAMLPNTNVTIPFTTLVVNDGKKLTLLDTGNGNSGAPTSGTWMTNFRAAGFTPEQVDTVVISHFHGDHINGLRLKEGTTVFANAEVMVPKLEWDFWMDDAKAAAAPDAMKGAFANVRRVFAPMKSAIKQYDAGKEVVAGINAVAAYGHTPGHTAFVIGGKLLALCDTTNTPALFVSNPGWHAVFDMDGAGAEATRRKMLDMAVTDKMQVAFYHAPFPATGHVVKDGAGYRLLPVAWSPAV
jgi:glyoxylase-like metal-dependent hydrolase (beta-lactamase superfamily II)